MIAISLILPYPTRDMRIVITPNDDLVQAWYYDLNLAKGAQFDPAIFGGEA